MSTEHDLFETRLAKARRARELGIDPYANDFAPDHTAAQVHARCGALGAADLDAPPWNDVRMRVAGRCMALRRFGKAAFIGLRDRTGEIQAYVKRDLVGEEAHDRFAELVDMGDVVGVTGRPFRTRTGELTIEAREVRLLTKALHPIPEKWHGLQDKETRYRQRWLDLISNEDVRRTFRTRSRIVQHIRTFLDARDYLEVETPMMHTIAGGAVARPFVTHHNALDLQLYLRIAPELYLKRLVTGGFERVYEINRNFRNEGLSTQHNPEFTMLEFYQAYATYTDLMDLLEEMLVSLVRALHLHEDPGNLRVAWQDLSVDFTPPWRRLSMREACRTLGGVPDEVFTDHAAALRFCKQAGAPIDPDATIEQVSHGKLVVEAFEATVQDKLVDPTFIYDYPIEVSPLSRRKPSDARLVDRFELYAAGFEIANAFSELNDPIDQRQRFEEQARARAAGDEEAMAYDENYVLCLEYGMPPTAGAGLGVDRLTLLMTDQPSIRDVILFPLMR